MKKFFATFAILAAMLVTLPANAQIKFGMRAGANLVNMKLDNSVLGSDNNAGFYVGPTVKFTVPIVGVSADASVLYDQRTAKVTSNGSEESFTARSIDIPINVRYGYGLSSIANVFVFTGPQFGFNISSDKSYLGVGDWTWKSSNFSWNVGLGATILSKVEVKANYNIACGKTGETKSTTPLYNGIKGKYNSWQLGLAYYF